MRLRTQASIVGMVLTLSSTLVNALGLGEIKLNTALNQPLKAEIPLLNVRELEEAEVIARLASDSDFERLGIDRPYFLTGLDFNVELDAPGGPTLYISSDEAVSEPFLNFAIQVEWPSGKLLREYTVLMDLPVYTGGAVQPVSPPGPSTYTPPSTSSAPATSRPVSRPSYDSDSYGPTGANDNLWTIASRTRPSGVSIQQAMIAIQRANPEAFIRDNINLLKRGKVLRIPGADEMQALARGEAVREVAQQNATFQNRNAEPSDSLPQLEGSKTFEPTEIEDTSVEGRVKLSAGESEGAQGIGSEEQVEIDTLQEELNVTEEQLDAATRENEELQDRAGSMEEQIDTLEKLIEINNEEMRNLELLAQQQNEEAETLVEEITDAATEEVEELTAEVEGITEEITEAIVDTGDTIEEGVDAALETTDDIRDALTEPEVTEPEVTPAEVIVPEVEVPKASDKGIVEMLMDNLLFIIIGVGVLILGLVGFLFARRGSDGFDDDDFDDMEEDEFEEDADVEVDDATVPLYTNDDEELPSDEEIAADLTSDELDFEESSEAETEDVVAECDIHIAYGQYDQAEEKLLNALEDEPANGPARLKLLEVYAAQSDTDKFDDHYSKLQVLGESDLVDRANALRDTIDDAPAYNRAAHDTTAFAALVGAAALAGSSLDSDANDDGLDLDLDLSSDLDLDSEDLDSNIEDEDITRIAPHAPEVVEDELQALDADLASDELDLDLTLDTDGNADDVLEGLEDGAFELEASLDEDNFELDASDFDEGLDTEDAVDALNPEFADSLVSHDTVTDSKESSAKEGSSSFDLDADLDDILSEDGADDTDLSDTGSLASGISNSDLDDVDLGELEELAPESASSDSADDLDLDGDFNLDELDQELDQLASDFDGDLGDLDTDLSLGEEETAEPSTSPASEPVTEEEPSATPTESKTDTASDLPDFDPDEDDDSNLGFLSDSDEVATKLDLARAYIDMGDSDGAKDIIDEIMEEGNDEQKTEAQSLLEKI